MDNPYTIMIKRQTWRRKGIKHCNSLYTIYNKSQFNATIQLRIFHSGTFLPWVSHSSLFDASIFSVKTPAGALLRNNALTSLDISAFISRSAA